MVSNPKMIEVRTALEAPANMADIPISAASVSVIPDPGYVLIIIVASNAPVAPPIVSKGASVPPEVPLPKEIAQETNFRIHSEKTICRGKAPDRTSIIFS